MSRSKSEEDLLRSKLQIARSDIQNARAHESRVEGLKKTIRTAIKQLREERERYQRRFEIQEECIERLTQLRKEKINPKLAEMARLQEEISRLLQDTH